MNIKIEFDAEAVMRDGTVLRANIFRPLGTEKYPVLITRLPYGKDTDVLNLINPVRLSASGYIVVVQDCRGRYASDGDFQSYFQEFADGYDSVEWAARLPYSDGSVGMFGTSYYGFTQWAAASMQPPSLRCIAPVFTFAGQWNGAAVQGGAYDWGKTALWYLQDIAPSAVSRMKENESYKKKALVEISKALEQLATEGYWTLPLDDFEPLRRLGIIEELFEQFTHPALDDFWERTSLAEHYQNITIPNLNIGGWYDLFVENTIRNFEMMRAEGVPSYLLIGPWSHMNRSRRVGEEVFSMDASAAMLNGGEDLTDLHQRWFDAHLKGQAEKWNHEPSVKIYVMGENRWRHATDWPLPETTYIPFYLESSGKANSHSFDGSLKKVLPSTTSTPDQYLYDPLNPVPTVGGNTLLDENYPPGPMDQQRIEECLDVLVYTSEALEEPMEVTGSVKVTLFVSSSAVDTDFIVRLTDVHPDGRSVFLCDGVLRMRFRNSWNQPELMTPGEIYKVRIDCGVTSNVFLKGHRIRVAVTSSNFPRWNRNLNTGRSNELTATTTVANQTVYHDADRPSHVLLPVIPR